MEADKKLIRIARTREISREPTYIIKIIKGYYQKYNAKKVKFLDLIKNSCKTGFQN